MKIKMAPKYIFDNMYGKTSSLQGARRIQDELWSKWDAVRNDDTSHVSAPNGSGKSLAALMMLITKALEANGNGLIVVADEAAIKHILRIAKQLGFYNRYEHQIGVIDFGEDPYERLYVTTVAGYDSNSQFPAKVMLLDDAYAINTAMMNRSIEDISIKNYDHVIITATTGDAAQALDDLIYRW